MERIDCEGARVVLFGASEPTAEQEALIASHLATCDACAAESERAGGIEGLLLEAIPAPPVALVGDILAVVEAERRRVAAVRRKLRGIALVAASVLVALLPLIPSQGFFEMGVGALGRFDAGASGVSADLAGFSDALDGAFPDALPAIPEMPLWLLLVVPLLFFANLAVLGRSRRLFDRLRSSSNLVAV